MRRGFFGFLDAQEKINGALAQIEQERSSYGALKVEGANTTESAKPASKEETPRINAGRSARARHSLEFGG